MLAFTSTLIVILQNKQKEKTKEYEVITSRFILFPLFYTSVLQSKVIILVLCSHFNWYKYQSVGWAWQAM